jgi:hypothetical protein
VPLCAGGKRSVEGRSTCHRYGPLVLSISTSALFLWSGVSALVGAVMWTYKSVVILATGTQPDYWFELALLFFGVSILLLVYAVRERLDRSPLLISTLGWVAALGGGAAAVAYIIGGDDGWFGSAALVTMLAIVVTLFLVGGPVRRDQLLPRNSFGPRLLAWLFVISLPFGAVISGIDERLLEVALLGTVVGWVILALGTLGRPSTA